MDIFILGLWIAAMIIISFFTIRYIIMRKPENQRVIELYECEKQQLKQQLLKQKINNIQDKISSLEKQKQETLNPIIHSTTSYFHYKLNKKVPLDNWELVPNKHDTAQSFKIKNATNKMVQKEFYNAANYESLEDFIESIAYKCLKKNLTTTKISFYGPQTPYKVSENLQDIIDRVYNYYWMNVENVSEYLVEEVYETLKEAFPKASDIDLWHSLFDYGKFFKIYHLEDELCKRYLEKNSNINFDDEIYKLQEQLEFYKLELRLK